MTRWALATAPSPKIEKANWSSEKWTGQVLLMSNENCEKEELALVSLRSNVMRETYATHVICVNYASDVA
jgi:hypothetical protein